MQYPIQHHNITGTSLQYCGARLQCCTITLQRRCRFSPMSAFAMLQVCIFAMLRQHCKHVVLQRFGNDSATKWQNCSNDPATLRKNYTARLQCCTVSLQGSCRFTPNVRLSNIAGVYTRNVSEILQQCFGQ